MFKWIRCFILGHKWHLVAKTKKIYEDETFIAYKTTNCLIRQCKVCDKFKEYETKAYYKELD
jgi:hypothetical protein